MIDPVMSCDRNNAANERLRMHILHNIPQRFRQNRISCEGTRGAFLLKKIFMLSA
jgi:hypothetical protein